jgi:hypothetical protein
LSNWSKTDHLVKFAAQQTGVGGQNQCTAVYQDAFRRLDKKGGKKG